MTTANRREEDSLDPACPGVENRIVRNGSDEVRLSTVLALGSALRKGVGAGVLLAFLGIVAEQITGLTAGDRTAAMLRRPADATSLRPVEGSEFPLLQAVVMRNEDGSGQCQYELALPMRDGPRGLAVRV